MTLRKRDKSPSDDVPVFDRGVDDSAATNLPSRARQSPSGEQGELGREPDAQPNTDASDAGVANEPGERGGAQESSVGGEKP